MEIYPDYKEFVACLNANGVRYLIVGAHAVAFHGVPRWTKDIDVWLAPGSDNAECFLTALRAFFGEDFNLTTQGLSDPATILQFGVPPVRIDVFFSIPGAEFESCWANRVTAEYGSEQAGFLSLDDLIRAKRASGRDQDLLDVKRLEEVKGRSEK